MLPARALVEAHLRARKLDVTLTSVLPPDPERQTGSTGLAWLDRRMDGGWPRGETSEIVGPASSGRTAVLLATLAAATQRGEVVAFVDACDRLDPPSAAAAGVELSRVLWVRGTPLAPSDTSHAILARALDRAIKAFGLVLQAGGFGVAAFDVADVPVRALKRLPFTTWLRLQRLVEGRDTIALIVASEPVGRSARGVTMRLADGMKSTPIWSGESDRARCLTGLALTPQIIAARRLPLADPA